MKTYLSVFFTVLSFVSFSQKYPTYIPVSDAEFGETENPIPKSSSYFFGNSLDYAVNQFAGVWSESVRNKRDQELYERGKSEVLIKNEAVKRQYANVTTFPEKIVDGWHNVISTDNINFCKSSKVLVKDNQIVRFVADGWLPLKVLPIGSTQIKKAQITVSLQDYNGQQLNIMDVYFIYDLERPTLTTEPTKPGYICFWTDVKKFDKIKLTIDGVEVEKLTNRFKKEPECFTPGMLCRVYKPGIYSFVALGRGFAKWNGTFEVKPGMCLRYKLAD